MLAYPFPPGDPMPSIADYPDDPKFNIHAVSQKTGILTVTLRAWERRYKVLVPKRAGNGYRLYSERDIAILIWLKNQVDSGISISTAAGDFLKKIHAGTWPEAAVSTSGTTPTIKSKFTPEQLSAQLYDSLVKHDEKRAASIFEEALGSFSLDLLCEKIIAPTLVKIGEAWYEGRIRVATEHFASTFIRAKLLAVFQSLPTRKNTPKILVGSAPGELHEIGPIMISVLLRNAGFQVEFLGPDIPLDDLVIYADSEQPRMIILSATLKESVTDLRKFQGMLNKLRRPPQFGYGGAAYLFT